MPSEGPVPVASMTLDPTTVEAQVTQSQLGDAVIQGAVEVDQPEYLTSDISISGTVNTGWPLELSRQSAQLTGPGTVEFTVTVVVPPATSSLLTGNVIIRASVKAPLVDPVMATASAVVTVSQYFKLRIELEEPRLELARGDRDRVEVTVYNDGNGQDTFALDLETVPDGFRVSLDETQVTIMSDESEVVVMEVRVEDSAQGGANTIVVRARSMESQDLYLKTAPIQVNVETFTSGMTAFDVVTYIILAAVVIAALALVVRRFRSRGGKGQEPQD